MRSSILLKSRTSTKPTKTQKISRIRRQRGYQWEDTLVKRFNKLDNWKAFRLGSPSVALPDILSLNNDDSIIFTIEAKSGTSTSLTVPSDQIIRCMNWTENFKVYQTREVILAFKFLSKKRIGNSLYQKRELREFFKVWNTKRIPIDIVCKYDGTTYGLINGKRKSIKLKDYKMPFKERKRSQN
jgi:Holliday junction resolvase